MQLSSHSPFSEGLTDLVAQFLFPFILLSFYFSKGFFQNSGKNGRGIAKVPEASGVFIATSVHTLIRIRQNA